MKNAALGDRMKLYENAYKYVLTPRTPLIIRLDGKAFHTLTAHCAKPFDSDVADAMMQAAKTLVENLQGACIAYTQSDEISVFIHNYKQFVSQPLFANELQKIVSISASYASTTFSREYGRIGIFDSRVFVLPEADVCNYFLWRQQDAVRNSIQMLARSKFSHSECNKKNCNELRQMLWEKHGIDWELTSTRFKRGSCVYKDANGFSISDLEIPNFRDDRDYINKYLVHEE